MNGRLTKAQHEWLKRIAVTGTWPSRPFLRDTENALPLMRMGLVEAIEPDAEPGRARPLAYAAITPAGREALRATENGNA